MRCGFLIFFVLLFHDSWQTTQKSGDIANQAGKGRGKNDTTQDNKGEARTEGKATTVPAGENVPSQPVSNRKPASAKEKRMGVLSKTYLDLSCKMQEAEKICQGRRDKIRAKRLQMEKVEIRISKEKNPIRLEELHKKLKKLSRGFKPELENDMDYEAKKAKQAAFEHESNLLDALHEVDTVTVTSKEDIQQVKKEVKMKCRLVIRANDWELIAHACHSGLDFLVYSP